jgi:hypothetical protein
MAIFNTDLEAIFYISLITLGVYAVNKLFSYLIKKLTKLSSDQKVKSGFIIRIISIFLIVFLIIEGFPSFTQIDPTFSAILTGSISTAFAFATSEIFANIMAGLLIFIIDPFDIGHIIKVNDKKGIIRSISLTKVVIETFDNIIIEFFNGDIVSSKIVNYTIDLEDVERFRQFKHKILSPQNKGKAILDLDFDDSYRDNEPQMRTLFELVSQQETAMIHNFTFRMRIPYKRLRLKIDKIDRLCQEYSEIFGIKPQFHIVDFANDVSLKFRILTLESQKLLDHQPTFAKDLYKIINKKLTL